MWFKWHLNPKRYHSQACSQDILWGCYRGQSGWSFGACGGGGVQMHPVHPPGYGTDSKTGRQIRAIMTLKISCLVGLHHHDSMVAFLYFFTCNPKQNISQWLKILFPANRGPSMVWRPLLAEKKYWHSVLTTLSDTNIHNLHPKMRQQTSLATPFIWEYFPGA